MIAHILFLDTDSDATPSGYLSEPEGNSIEIGETANMNDATRWVHFYSLLIHSDESRKGCWGGGLWMMPAISTVKFRISVMGVLCGMV